jgi:hypothetical protein
MALDRLEAAWTAFEALSRSERREFLRRVRDWHLQRRIEAVASRGGDYRHRRRVPPVPDLADALAEVSL